MKYSRELLTPAFSAQTYPLALQCVRCAGASELRLEQESEMLVRQLVKLFGRVTVTLWVEAAPMEDDDDVEVLD